MRVEKTSAKEIEANRYAVFLRLWQTEVTLLNDVHYSNFHLTYHSCRDVVWWQLKAGAAKKTEELQMASL